MFKNSYYEICLCIPTMCQGNLNVNLRIKNVNVNQITQINIIYK